MRPFDSSTSAARRAPRAGVAGAAFAAFAMAAAVAGCGPGIVMHPAGADVLPRRVAAVPTRGIEWEFDFSGHKTPREDWTLAARSNLDAAINYQLSLRGGHSFEDPNLRVLPGYARFARWSEETLLDIMGAALRRSSVPHASVLEWSYGPTLEAWRKPLRADFVLVALFLDGHNTPGRAVAVGFAGGRSAAQRAIACVVRMTDGRVVWCELADIGRWNIRGRAGAENVTRALIGELLVAGAQLPSAPPSSPPPAVAAPASPSTEPPAVPAAPPAAAPPVEPASSSPDE